MPSRLLDLSPAMRRRTVLVSAVRIVAVWVTLVAGYYLLPLRWLAGWRTPVLVILVTLLFGAVVAWTALRVERARVPQLRAIEAVGFTIPLYLVMFAAVYLSIAGDAAANFSQPLDHSDALYLTVTMFATVGFGDIVPVTTLARLVASVQMLLNLVVLGSVVKIMFGAGRRAVDRAAS